VARRRKAILTVERVIRGQSISLCHCHLESKTGTIRHMMRWKATFTMLAALFASIALADDFKTIDGKEYKNAKVSRVEPDGLVLITKSGISKVYFTELPKEVQERYHYNPQEAAEFTGQSVEQNRQFLQQRAADEQKRTEERTRYWSANPTPAPVQGSLTNALSGNALDRPASDQATTAVFLVSQYATNQINAERLYTGKTFTISGTIKSIDLSEGRAVVELFVPGYWVGKAWFMHCIFSDPSGLDQYQAGNPIGVVGTVAGLKRYTLVVKDCRLAR
jgi:putative nucleic acid binding protein